MENNFNVKITYRNAKLEPVSTQLYSLEDYTDMLRSDQLKIITDVEDGFYVANGNKCKDEWPDDVWGAFVRIKHKLLDKAGSIGRLPENIVKAGGSDACE